MRRLATEWRLEKGTRVEVVAPKKTIAGVVVPEKTVAGQVVFAMSWGDPQEPYWYIQVENECGYFYQESETISGKVKVYVYEN